VKYNLFDDPIYLTLRPSLLVVRILAHSLSHMLSRIVNLPADDTVTDGAAAPRVNIGSTSSRLDARCHQSMDDCELPIGSQSKGCITRCVTCSRFARDEDLKTFRVWRSWARVLVSLSNARLDIWRAPEPAGEYKEGLQTGCQWAVTHCGNRLWSALTIISSG
jgi:hypothetical protein